MKKTKASIAHIIYAKYCDSYAGLPPSLPDSILINPSWRAVPSHRSSKPGLEIINNRWGMQMAGLAFFPFELFCARLLILLAKNIAKINMNFEK